MGGASSSASCIRGGFADLQVDFRAAHRGQRRLTMGKQSAVIAFVMIFRQYRKIIQPAAMPIIAEHGSSDGGLGMTANKKQLRLNRQFAGNISPRIVPRPRQFTSPPDSNNCIRISHFKWP